MNRRKSKAMNKGKRRSNKPKITEQKPKKNNSIKIRRKLALLNPPTMLKLLMIKTNHMMPKILSQSQTIIKISQSLEIKVQLEMQRIIKLLRQQQAQTQRKI